MAGADENTPLLGASGGARQVLKSSLCFIFVFVVE